MAGGPSGRWAAPWSVSGVAPASLCRAEDVDMLMKRQQQKRIKVVWCCNVYQVRCVSPLAQPECSVRRRLVIVCMFLKQ